MRHTVSVSRPRAAGDVVHIPAGVKHWQSWFSHLAVEVPGENTRNEWLEPVSNQDFQALS